jgi:hypothetical protein
VNAHATALAIARTLSMSGTPALDPVHIYAHDTEVLEDGTTINPVEEIELPAVFVRVKCESLTGSATIGKARVEIDVESQSDDSSSEEHSAREAAVRAVLADQPALLEAFDAVGTVELLGRPSLAENDPDVESRAFKTPLTYRAGVRSL